MNRAELERQADAILAANPESKVPPARIRYQGTRPAMTWLAKRDPEAAAALWLLARERLPREAANDNAPTAEGLSLDRRKGGKPRGTQPVRGCVGDYLALPGVVARLGDAEPAPAVTGRWDGRSRGITMKPQRARGDFPLYPFGRFTRCRPAVATGALFLGAGSGLGLARPGKTRGDVRGVTDDDAVELPADVERVVETVLSGGNLADVGYAFGAKGGAADRRGGKAILAAGRWAKQRLAA